MILIDFAAVAVTEAMTLAGYDSGYTKEDLAGVVLSKISQISAKHKQKYGKTVVCTEGKGNWRRDVYPLYKKHRSTARKKSTYDWALFYEGFDLAIEIIQNELQWKLLHVDMTEADDCISVLARRGQGKILIVSRDGDFFQLHNANVQQYDFSTHKMLSGKKFGPDYFHTKFVKGSAKENVANIQMPIDHITEGEGRQKAVSKKFLASLVLEGDLLVRYNENKALMDLSLIPSEIQEDIVVAYRQQLKAPIPTIKEMGTSLREHGFRILARNVEDFID